MARRVLLYSGGLDSYCLSKLYDIDLLLFIQTGTPDNRKEWELINHHIPGNIIPIKLPLAIYELGNKIIPFRNHLFILMAAQFGNEIYIGATAGDTTKDKDFVFKAQMESILNYFALDTHKVTQQGYPYKVIMPFKQMTKTEIVKAYLKKYPDWDKLFTESRSCYEGFDKECGECRSCVRKYVALMNNVPSNQIADKFQTDPTIQLNVALHEAKEKGRDNKEIKEIETVLSLIYS
jgi:7-cyano-7-deazaguanine synthase